MAIRLFFLLAITFAPNSAAGGPWSGEALTTPPAELLAAAAEAQAPEGSALLILHKDVSHVFDAEGRRTFRRHLTYKLLTQEGIDAWSGVGASWSPWHQKVPQIRARVITPDGAEHLLDQATFSEGPTREYAPDIYDDRRLRQAPLPALRIGAVVEEETVVQDLQPFFDAGTTGQEFFIDNFPIAQGRVILEAPISLPLRYGTRLADQVELNKERIDDRIRLTFTYKNAAAAELAEVGLPALQARFPKVAFSTGSDWQQIAQAYNQVVETQLQEAPLDALLADLPAGLSDFERIEWLLAKLHSQVRYTGLELGAASIIPATPAETLRRQFGDCKDKATLLTSMLRQSGIPAHVALLKADYGQDVEPKLPGLGSFNHAIVYAPGTRPIWIDPTNPFARAGQLPAADQGRLALIATPETHRLVLTPTANSIDNRIVETREIFMADYGPGRIVETTQYFGVPEMRQRSYSGGDPAERREGYSRYTEAEYLTGNLTGVEETVPDDLSQPFTLRLEMEQADRSSSDLDEAAVGVNLSDLLNEMPEVFTQDGFNEEEKTSRKHPYVFHTPFVQEWHYRIHVPTGMLPRSLPESGTEKLGTATFEHQVHFADGVLQADYRFDSGLRRLTPEQFLETRRALVEFSNREIQLLYFDHQAASHLAAGRSNEAIREYQRLAKTEPDRTFHHIRLARGMLAVGLGEEALRAAEKAITVDPNNAMAHWASGFVRSHDAIGRLREPGYDRQGAIAALKKASNLEPENSLIRAELAILFDFDAEGQRYTRGADLDLAIEAYRRWRKDFDSSNLDENLLSSLFWAERWKELRTLADELPAEANNQVWKLTAIGAEQGPKQVLKTLEAMGANREEQVNLLASAAQKLLLVRQYKTAAALVRQAAKGSTNPAGTLNYAELLEAIQKREEIPLPIDDPTTALKKFFLLLAEPNIGVEDIIALLHPDTVEEALDDEDALELQRQFSQGVSQAAQGVPLEVAIELALTVFDFTPEGDDQNGYRIRFASSMPNNQFESTAFVKRHNNEYRILTFEGDGASLAREALRQVAEADLTGARLWLDWAREKRPIQETDDPLAGHAFSKLWKRGGQGDTTSIRRAAAALLAQDEEATEGDAVQALPILQQSLDLETSEERRHQLEIALTHAHNRLENWPEVVAINRRLAAAHPTSDLALTQLFKALQNAGRFQELRREAQAILAPEPTRTPALLALTEAALQQADIAEGIEWLEQAQEHNSDNSLVANLLAWAQLFNQPIPDTALTLAQEGAKNSNYESYGILNTLAMAYASVDKPLEAYQVVVQALSKAESTEPGSNEWLVLGRIAESYGLTEWARTYYQRVEPAEDSEIDTLSAQNLAQIRLSTLPKPKKKGRRSN